MEEVSIQEKEFELSRIRDQFAKCSAPIITEDVIVNEFGMEATGNVHLQTIVYRPNIIGSIPAIAVRTCYPKNDYIYRATAMEYARRGFSYIFQYCRGSGESEGEWEPNVNERVDGKAFIDWVCAQDWINSVGYAGCSYLSLTGWVIADILPEKVKTMYLTHYGTFRHVSAYQDGMFRHDVLTAWAMENAGHPVDADYEKSCSFRPQICVDEAMWGGRLDWYRKWITSTDSDDEYWNTGFWGMLKEIPTKVKIPIYLGEGWYDHHLGSAIETYKALSHESRSHSRFLIGAWDHNFNIAVEGQKGTHFENNDILRTFDWFYRILVNGENPTGSIDTYIIGDDRWYSRTEYEIQNQKEKVFYLANKSDNKVLVETADQEQSAVSYEYDPETPVRTWGAESCLRSGKIQGSKKQPEQDYRSDVLSFISEPMVESFTVLGSIHVNLVVATDADDTAFVVKVMEVMEDGSTYNMRTGITTLGYRNGSKHRISYTPGEPVEVDIRMWDLAWKVQKNSRIRIDITSSDFPQYSVHSNYSGCWATIEKTKKAKQIVYIGKGESYVSFPLL